MRLAIEEAKKAKARGDYAFGAVVARGDELLASGGNRVKTKNDSTKHVELEVIQYAVGLQHERYLTGCTIYTTCEPCLMCFGACYWSGLERIVYGMSQDDLGKHGKEHGTPDYRYRPSPLTLIEIMSALLRKGVQKLPIKVEGLMRKECLELLQ